MSTEAWETFLFVTPIREAAKNHNCALSFELLSSFCKKQESLKSRLCTVFRAEMVIFLVLNRMETLNEEKRFIQTQISVEAMTKRRQLLKKRKGGEKKLPGFKFPPLVTINIKLSSIVSRAIRKRPHPPAK